MPAEIASKRTVWRIVVTILGLAVMLATTLTTSASATSQVDRGRPLRSVPSWFRGQERTIWRTEWQVVAGAPMRQLARDPDVRLSQGTLRSWLAVSPQYAAQRLAHRIETGDAGAGWTGYQLEAAIDGCRNGILWSYYH